MPRDTNGDAVEQPAQEAVTMADGVFVRRIGPIATEGTLLAQHSHAYDHTTLVVSGAVRAWEGEIWLGDYAAPAEVFIKGHALHRFLTLAPATVLYCVHNTSRTGKVEELQQATFPGPPDPEPDFGDGVTVQEEPWPRFWRDGQALFRKHETEIGPRVGGGRRELNVPLVEEMDRRHALQVVTARCNGRMAGYLVSILSPSIDVAGTVNAVATAFYVDRDFRGVGPRLMHRSIDLLRAKGASEVLLRTGLLGSGPKAGALYRRLGAVPNGELYTLKLRETA